MNDNLNVNPLFENVRQAMGLNTNITEEVPVRLPPNVSTESVRNKLPSWLLEVVNSRTGKTQLAECFQVHTCLWWYRKTEYRNDVFGMNCH